MKHSQTLDINDAPVERSDMELVELARSGNKDAFGELWTRHYHAALRAAKAISSSHDPEDLVQESFMRIYQAILKDSGPKEVFRAYLYTVLRSVSMKWGRNGSYESSLDDIPAHDEPAYSFEGQVVADSVTARAFTGLKPEWRAVLWYLDVEEMKPAEAAPLLGLSANSTSALAYRAREALRSAWLQAHLNSDKADEKCKWSVERLGAYNRGTLSARDKSKLQDHLVTCLKCSILVEEVDQISKNLGLFLVPMLLGPAAFSYLDTISEGTLAADPVPPNPLAKNWAGASKIGFGVLASAITAGGLIAAGMFMFPSTPDLAITGREPLIAVSPESTQLRSEPSSAPTSAAAESSTEPAKASLASIKADPQPKIPLAPASVTSPVLSPIPDMTAPTQVAVPAAPLSPPNPTPFPEPTAPPVTVEPTPTPSSEPTTPTSPSPSPEPSPTPTAPVAPVVLAVPSIDSVTEQGLFLPVLKGTGVPGATVTVLTSGVPLQTALVDPAGSWTLVPDFTLTTNTSVSFTAFQSFDGLVSEATAPTELVSVATPVIGEIQYTNGIGEVSFSGPSGSTVEVLIDGNSTGNLHVMDGAMVVRRLPSLAPGQHSLTLRFVDRGAQRRGAGVMVTFDVPPTRREAPAQSAPPDTSAHA